MNTRLKRICLTAAFVLLMALCVASAAFADEIIADGECGAEKDNVTWTLTDDGVLTISGTGDMADHDPEPIHHIYNDDIDYDQECEIVWDYSDAAPWEEKHDSILSVKIEEGVTRIGNGAFVGCSLTDVTIPDSVTRIGDGAFRECAGLAEITIPERTTSIGNYAFYGCNSLISITVPGDVTSIGDGAFENCSSLKRITVPDSVTSIGDEVFCECESLRSMSIPKNVKSIGDRAFYDCGSLKSITIPEGVTSIGNYAFYDCGSLKSITIPESVTSIGDSAFERCSGLQGITIPESVTSIGNKAFFGCYSLKSITIPDSVKAIKAGTFNSCTDLDNVILLSEDIDIEKTGDDHVNDEGAFDFTDTDIYIFKGTKAEANVLETEYADRVRYLFGKGTSFEATKAALTSVRTDEDMNGTTYRKLRLRQSGVTKNSISVKWEKVKGAGKYVIFAGKSGKNNKLKKISTTTKTKYTLRKLNDKKLAKGTYYKFEVVALDSEGKVITASKFVHIATLGKKSASDPAKVTTKAKKNNVTLGVKKTFKLKGSCASSAKKYKIRKILGIRYESTNPKIATVSSKGVVKGIGKGTCYVYAYAQNGISKKIRVTVKK